MEEKTDKVVGYIEYLGAGGMIGEIVPYTSVEKFKDEILDSLDCGRPVTPVVFSDELDEPLQFDSDTYFPWGFRSEKRVQIPYRQIEQTMQTLMQQSTAPNRQTDPMGWTQWMNALQSQAEELAMQQIYSL